MCSVIDLVNFSGEDQMKPFWLERIEDESGISSVGRVAEGVVFSNDWCVMT